MRERSSTIHKSKLNTDYSDRNNAATTFYHEGRETATAGTFIRSIGNTVYRVNVYSVGTGKETMTEKIIHLVRNEAVSL